MEKEHVAVQLKYKISYRIGVKDQIHLDTVYRTPGEPILCLQLPFEMEDEGVVFVQVRFDDTGVGVLVPSEVHPGLTWRLKVATVEILLPVEAWVVIAHPVSRLRLTQVPLAQTGIQIMIEAS